MLECDADSPVPDWIIDYPESLAVFRELGIDYCCGGKSLAFACQEQGIPVARVLERLHQEIERGKPAGGSNIDPRVASIQVGLPRTLGQAHASEPFDRMWTTGYHKNPVQGPVRLGSVNLEGDAQADLVHHGGPDKAVLVYSAEHYPDWRRTLSPLTLPFGAFGENFTVEKLTEANVCIGDSWQVGNDVLIQVSQPRQPCWKLARRWRIKTLALQVQQSGRTGWYCRVLQQGIVAAGMPLILKDRLYPQWTVARANRVLHGDRSEVAEMVELSEVPLLSENWQKNLARRAQRGLSDQSPRLIGENA